MNEILMAFILFFISAAMSVCIYFLIKIDNKIKEINDTVSDIKKTDFGQLKKVVSIAHKINKTIKLGKIREIVDISLSVISGVQLFMLYKKVINNFKNKAN